MDRAEFEDITLDLFGAVPEHPFERDQSISVFRHASNRKWFGVIMTIPKSRLGIDGDGCIDIINLKCPKEILYSLCREDGIYPAYHMSKTNWITALLDGTVDTDTLKWLLSISFELTKPKPRKRTTS